MLGGENLGTLRVNIEANLKDFNTSISTAQASLRTWGQSMTNVVNQNREALTMLGTSMAGVGAVLVGGVGMAVKTFADFESAMKNVQSISNATQKEFEDLSAYAMKLGKDTVFSSKQAAEALYYMASAGYSVKDQMKATDSVLQLATATQWGLAQAAEFTATTITAFGLKAENAGHVVDVMAKASAMSQATMEKLGWSLPYVATQAHMLGLSLETTVAALSLLYDGGLKGEMAGERLRGALNSLLNPTLKEQEALEKMGITLDSVSPTTNKLSDIVKVFESHTKLAGDAQWNAANATKIFGERAEGMTVLVAQGSTKLIEYEKNLTNSAGAAQKMADIQQQALLKSFEQLKGSIENLLIKMGGELAPTVKSLAGFFEGLTDKIASINPVLVNAGVHFAAIGGALGIVGGGAVIFIAQLPQLLAGLQAINTMGLRSAIAIGKAGLVIAGIVALGEVIGKIHSEVVDPVNKATNALNMMQTMTGILSSEMEKFQSQGLSPVNITLGELRASSDLAEQTIKGLSSAMGATYGDYWKLSDFLLDLSDKTREYRNIVEGTTQVTKASAPVKDDDIKKTQEQALATAKMASEEESLKEAQKKLLDQMKSELNPAFEKSAEIFQNIRIDTHALKLVTDEMGFSYKALTPIIHETAKRSQEDSVETMKVQKEAFDANISGLKTQGDMLKTISDIELTLTIQTWDKIGQYFEDIDKQRMANFLKNIGQFEEAALILAEKDEANMRKGAEAYKEWYNGLIANAIDYKNKLIENNDKQYQKEEEQLLKFESNKAKIYDSEKEQLALTYVDMYNMAVGHGKNTVDIEKWYHDENLKLTMQYYNDYAEIVQGATSSVAESYLGLHHLLTNSDMDQEALQKTAIVRLANWVDDQVKLLKDLEDAYTSVTKVIGILGTVIDWLSGKSGGSSGGGIGDLTSLLSSGGETSGGGGILSKLSGLFAGGAGGGTAAGTYGSYMSGGGAAAGGAGGTSWLGSIGSSLSKATSAAGSGISGAGSWLGANALGIVLPLAAIGIPVGIAYSIWDTLSGRSGKRIMDEYEHMYDRSAETTAKDEAWLEAQKTTRVNLTGGGYYDPVTKEYTGSPNYTNSVNSINTGLNNIDTSIKNLTTKYDRDDSLVSRDIRNIIEKTGSDNTQALNSVSSGLNKVDDSINSQIKLTNTKLDIMIDDMAIMANKQPLNVQIGTLLGNQAGVDALADQIAQSLRRRNVM